MANDDTSLSINELIKFGGIESTVKLLDSNNSVIAENAALVLANSTHESDDICVEFVKNSNSLKAMLGHLRVSKDTIKRCLIRIISNLTSVDPELTGVSLVSTLRNEGVIQLLIDNLGSNNNQFAKYSAISLGNLTCEDSQLREEVCENGGIPSLLGMASTPSLISNAVSALANITYNNLLAVNEIIKLNGLDMLIEIAKRQFKQSSNTTITECILNILSNCAKESKDVCVYLLTSNSISLFVDALDSTNENLQEYSIKILCSILTAKVDNIYSRKARATIAKNGLITPFVLLLDHNNKEIHSSAIASLTTLRCGEGEMLVPFLETGTVPLLYLLQQTTKDDTVKHFTLDMLDWMRGELHGPSLALMIRTLHLEGNEAVRSALSQSLICLSIGTTHIFSAFIEDGGLDATLEMLSQDNEASITCGVEFLHSFEPIADSFYKNQRDNNENKIILDAVILDKENFNNESKSNFIVYVERKPFFAHKEVLYGNSEYFKLWLDENDKDNIKSLSDPHNTSYFVFGMVMEHVYFGTTTSLFDKISADHLKHGMDLLKAANVYKLKYLSNVCGVYCCKYVTAAISITLLMDILDYAIEISMLPLALTAYSSMIIRIRTILKTSVIDLFCPDAKFLVFKHYLYFLKNSPKIEQYL